MNDLEIILAHLKDEKSKLKSQLDGCLNDFDYEGAHLFQKAFMSKSTEVRGVMERLEGNRQEIGLNQ